MMIFQICFNLPFGEEYVKGDMEKTFFTFRLFFCPQNGLFPPKKIYLPEIIRNLIQKFLFLKRENPYISRNPRILNLKLGMKLSCFPFIEGCKKLTETLESLGNLRKEGKST